MYGLLNHLLLFYINYAGAVKFILIVYVYFYLPNHWMTIVTEINNDNDDDDDVLG